METNRIMDNIVTNPELIKTLNAMGGYHDDSNELDNQSSDNDQPQQSTLSSLAHVPYDLAVGAGGGIQNIGHGLLPGLVPKFEPQGIAQSIGEPIGNISAYMLGPEAALLRGAKGVQSLAGLGETGWTALSHRLASSGLYGAINEPDDRIKGATIGLATGGAGEGLGALLGKGLPKSAEFLYPKKYANDLAESIYKNYQSAQNASSELYNPVFEKLGEKEIYKSPKNGNYSKLDDQIFKTYDYDLENLHKEFLKEPTLNKAHELQSDIGNEISAIKSENNTYADRNAIKKLTAARNSLKDDINTFLNDKNPDLLQQYKNAASFHRTNVVPYMENKNIRNIVSGQQETITPESLRKSLQQLSEIKTGKNKEYLVPKGHYLNKAYNDISHRINRGEAAGTAGSLGSVLAGAGLGNIIHPGLAGTILGGGLGAGASFAGKRYLMPKVLDLSTNPAVHETLPKLKVPYDLLVKSLINAQTG
jgi:hypothetical protein